MTRLQKKQLAREKVYIKRLLFMGFVATIVMMLLVTKLYSIQIRKNDLYATEVNKQRWISIPTGSNRGIIFDRNYIPLTNRKEKNVAVVFPKLFIISDSNITFLQEITGIDKELLIRQIKNGGQPLEFPVTVELNWDDKKLVSIRGLFIINKKVRYEEKSLLNHVIGYTSSIDQKGMYGLERAFDDILTHSGSSTIAAVVDGRKRIIPGEGYTIINATKNPNNIRLTIDYHIQNVVENVMNKYQKEGAVVISDIETGEILAMCSRPGYNPNMITNHINSSGDELFNKAIQMPFPPGSVFKIVVTAEALRQEKLHLGRKYYCSGVEKIGDVEIHCNVYESGGHGELTFEEAFAHSCNSIFIQLGQELGALNIIEMAEKFGLGEKVSIGLLEEQEGNLPKGDHLLGPAIGNIAIGQGEIEVTPLQINQLTQIIGNGGIKKPLFLVQEILDDNYNTVKDLTKKEETRVLPREDVEILHRLLQLVMKQGTGSGIGALSSVTAGKTGTAESSERGQQVLHAWFTGYYYKEKPQYAITVFIQNGGSGGKAAVPIFKEIVENIIKLGY